MDRTNTFMVPTWQDSRANRGSNYKSYILSGQEVEGFDIPFGTGSGLRLVYEFLSSPLKAGQVYVNSFGLDGQSVVSPLPNQYGIWTLDSSFQVVEWDTRTRTQTQTTYILRPALEVLASQGTDRDRFILSKFSKVLDALSEVAKKAAIQTIASRLSSIYFWVPAGSITTSFKDSQVNTAPGPGTQLTPGPGPRSRFGILPLVVSGVGLATGNPVFIGLGFALRIFGAQK